MTNQQDISKPENSQINFVHEGMELGCKAGFRLSTLYAISAILFIGIFGGGGELLNWLTSVSFSWHRFIHTIPLLIGVAFIIFFVAIGPATVLGTLTGMMLGKFANIFIGRMSKYFLAFSCALLSTMIAILIHLFFDIQIGFSFQQSPIAESNYLSMGIFETYPFYMGIPTILYIFAGGWTGWQLYLKSLVQMGKEN